MVAKLVAMNAIQVNDKNVLFFPLNPIIDREELPLRMFKSRISTHFKLLNSN